MTVAEAKDLVLAVSGSVSMVAVAIGIWLSLREYRLKLRAEARQQAIADVEADVRLQTLFSELMKTANGRSGYVMSEKAVEFLLRQTENTPAKVDIESLNQAIEDLAILTLPVGSAAQEAAVASIGVLTLRHATLETPGLRALESLCNPATARNAVTTLSWVKQELAKRTNLT